MKPDSRKPIAVPHAGTAPGSAQFTTSSAPLREIALDIYRAAVARVDPDAIVEATLCYDRDADILHVEGMEAPIDLGRFARVLVIGAGKATAPMARAAERVLGDRLTEGVIVVKPGHGVDLNRVELLFGDHPVPGQASIDAAREVLRRAGAADEGTFVLNLLSGGGSALLTLPYIDEHGKSPVSPADVATTTSLLLAAGADIRELNTVRKHLSAIAGGRLAAALAPATSLSLVLSDVVGDDLSVVASGPTVGDATTYDDALRVLSRRDLLNKVPTTVREFLNAGASGAYPETPAPGDPVLGSTVTVLAGTNAIAIEAAAEEAVRHGFPVVALTTQLTGEAREVARVFAATAGNIGRRGANLGALHPPVCILTGGETTVTLRGEGTGGRNQEMALAVLAQFAEAGVPEDVCFLSCATDGNDGPTDAAGGFADAEAVRGAIASGVDIGEALADNDSYHALQKIGALVKTGPTNTNVCDLQLVLVR